MRYTSSTGNGLEFDFFIFFKINLVTMSSFGQRIFEQTLFHAPIEN